MTSMGEIRRKFSIRMRSGGVIKEKAAPVILFMEKFLVLFVFVFGKQLFRFILQKI
jgi:hypothetical protein